MANHRSIAHHVTVAAGWKQQDLLAVSYGDTAPVPINPGALNPGIETESCDVREGSFMDVSRNRHMAQNHCTAAS